MRVAMAMSFLVGVMAVGVVEAQWLRRGRCWGDRGGAVAPNGTARRADASTLAGTADENRDQGPVEKKAGPAEQEERENRDRGPVDPAAPPAGPSGDTSGLRLDARQVVIEAQEPDKSLFGVEEDKVDRGQSKYFVGGKCVSRVEAMEAIMKGELPDDAGKLRLTLIGAAADRARVEKDLEGEALKDIRGRLLVWSVPADDWSVKGLGFVSTGSPTIYLQGATGQVLHRQDDYQGPADLQAIRKAVAGYDAKKDPDLRGGGTGGVPGWAAALGGALGLWWLMRRPAA